MRIWTSPYRLPSRAPLSGWVGGLMNGRGERDGALLKVETAEGVGYADLHPWPELGDEPLAQQLRALQTTEPHRLGRRALAWAEVDRRARTRGMSAFAGLRLPENHKLITDRAAEFSDEGLCELWAMGFRSLKIKMSRDWRSEIRAFGERAGALQPFRLRLDFNGQLRPDEFFEFCERLSPTVREVVEFVEDPVAGDVVSWNQLVVRSPVAIALDRKDGAERLQTSLAQWLIWKPALEEESTVADWCAVRGEDARVSVTSYLDHPLGQVAALYGAARLLEQRRAVGTCGLASHLNFEKNEFSEALTMHGAILYPPSGTGFGFDELLSRQNWREL